mmetsp:Transcript_7063/g.20475  ORF Transcript_7063/g.20475 Transcript_7063/m.20475 type:complete len:102 (-) Transcript_7063:58-363(-)
MERVPLHLSSCVCVGSLCAGRELCELSGVVSEAQMKTLFNGIFTALAFIHARGLAYNDIKVRAADTECPTTHTETHTGTPFLYVRCAGVLLPPGQQCFSVP